MQENGEDKMGNLSKLIKKMHKTKLEFDENMNEHLKELSKIRGIIKSQNLSIYNQNLKQNFCQHCGSKL